MKPSIFLCLSGGGLRALLFHYGCLKRLQEVGLLGHVHTMSATSGGSITATTLALTEGPLDRDNGTYTYRWDDFEDCVLELARRGLLGPTTLLVSAYLLYAAGLILFLLGIYVPPLRPMGLATGAVGIVLHLALLCDLAAHRAEAHYDRERAWARYMHDRQLPAVSPASLARFLEMALVPSALRRETMNLRLFSGAVMPLLGRRIYLNAVDLNDGRQKIFAHCGVVNLDAVGCGKLWRQYSEDFDHEVPIAQAVGASSAIPPIFRPVAVRDGNALVGVFVDGGVADNLALNLAKAFSVHIHRGSGSSYQDDGQGYASFQKFISFILVLDGSMPLGEKRKTSWTRLFSIKRVSEAMMNQQVSEAAIATFGFERTMNIPCAIASLQFGMPGNVGADVPDVGHLFKRVRTHLDSFSRQECAVLAYCGYATIDLMLRERPSMLAKYRGARDAPLRAFGDILPERCGAWDPAPESVERTMRYAHRRLLPLRWLGRTVGI